MVVDDAGSLSARGTGPWLCKLLCDDGRRKLRRGVDMAIEDNATV